MAAPGRFLGQRRGFVLRGSADSLALSSSLLWLKPWGFAWACLRQGQASTSPVGGKGLGLGL